MIQSAASPKPALSVVTPSFRQLEWLRLCAASVADQEDVCVEHLVQDAGTGKELESWGAAQPNLRLYVERDAGMYDAVNRGLRRATGDICSYLNCDEQYLPGALAKVAAFFQTHPEIDVLFGDAVLIDDQCRPIGYRRVIRPGLYRVRVKALPVLTCATFFRRSLVERGLLFEPTWRFVGDSVWVHSLLRARVPMAVVAEPLAAFAFTGNNLTDHPDMRAESMRWHSRPGMPPKWLRQPLLLNHRVRKLLAGAYLPRCVEVELYSRESPAERRRWKTAALSPFWPGTSRLPPPPCTACGPRDASTQ